ncbi:DUF885 domain-containing protein [Simiduia curdlanivorans]|uniref:DUF885 domain-containing protein n=1 Tax=Simiduia curdlanivorans TaxID=1492769 RepID=A0ABV8V3U0_9GAMM|nr:DUF885 domain-containing protein [Simiduia curdlanivorans]MDN3640055.1 DUF885 domain-containing protein [Simiduia curdlanivorans]
MAFSFLLAGCSKAPSEKAEIDTNVAFDQYKNAFLESFWQVSPEYALYNGRYEFASHLRINDAAARAADAEFISQHMALLAKFSVDELNGTNKGDWAIIDNELRSWQWRLSTFKDYQWNPSHYNVAGPIGLILNTEYAPIEERLAAINERLIKVPAYYQAAEANIVSPALPQTLLAIDQNRGAIGLLEGGLQEAIESAAISEKTKQDLVMHTQQAVAAIEHYVEFLEQMVPALEAGGAKDFRIGEALYEQKFSFDIVSEFSAKQVYEMALAEKAKIHVEMATLAEQLWPRYFPEQPMPEDSLILIGRVIEQVSLEHAKPSEFVAAVQTQIPALDAFVVEHDLMDTDRNKPLVVRETPAYQRGFSIASIEAPGPYDSAANTYYNVSPVDDLSPEMQESHLREYNSYTMQILNIHEAVPGHYTQLVHANKSPSLIKAIFGNGAMIEGWAVYTERMMLEQGYGEGQPELWLMYYKWNLRTVVNTILDYSIQVLGMDEQAALALLMNEAFQEEAEARGKWRRASLSQVQLTSYFTGYKEIYAFREEQKQRLGEDFNLKAFHNEFLGYGSAPVKVIKDNMRAH